jgi:type IV pilus assembly protein PilP
MKLARLLALAVLAGCGEDEPNVVIPPVTPKNPAAAAAPAAVDGPTDATAGNYTYTTVGKRDPFRSYIADLREIARAEESRRPESTEKFELDQYRLTGLVTGTSQAQAMVEDPDGMGHVVRVGTRLGKNGGRVTRIAVDQIVVTEEFRAPTGERVRVPITVRLPRSDTEIMGEQQQADK